jgi:hypothetical protein
MHRAGLADETGPEPHEYLAHPNKRQPEAMRCSGIVRPVQLVVAERDGLNDLLRPGVDRDVHADVAQRGHRRMVEAGHGPGLEGHLSPRPVGRSKVEYVVDEVELDL